MAADFLPYGRQLVGQDDVDAVVEVLRSDWLTTGPKVRDFESAFAAAAGVEHGVALINGTAALHAMMFALELGPGDEVIVPAMTFAATSNAAVYQGATPIFADVRPDTLLLDSASVEARINERTRCVVGVDYAGQPCDYDELRALCSEHDLHLLADACHSPGGALRGRPVGSLAEASAFSFHPVKPLTTGEGGMITTSDERLAERARQFRNHGITQDFRHREEIGTWFYEMVDLGYNYRLSDINCALGLSQLAKLEGWTARRRELAAAYRDRLAGLPVEPLQEMADAEHAYHLFVVRVPDRRDDAFAALRAEGIGVNVHYIPVHLHPYYRDRFGTGEGLCPVAEDAYRQILTLPLFPAMTSDDIDRVADALGRAIQHNN